MRRRPHILKGTVAAMAALLGGTRLIPKAHGAEPSRSASPLADKSPPPAGPTGRSGRAIATNVQRAVDAFKAAVRPLSHPRALESAFQSYFAYRAAHPANVRKPLLYFVDYGLSATTPRGYVFDMVALQIIDGPFTVAHGRGSAATSAGVPTRFSNAPGSAASSLGLFVTEATYPFQGKAGGQPYRSIGLRLSGVSGDYNSNALARGVVAHGAPYVTASRAGQSEGCPAMDQARARRLLPALADGGMVFLFAPDTDWLSGDPWLTNSG